MSEKESPKKWQGERGLCNGCSFLSVKESPECSKGNLILRCYFAGRPLYLPMYKNCKDKK